MPILELIVAGASLFGGAKVLYDALEEDLVEPEVASGGAAKNSSALASMQKTWEKWRDSATSSLAEFEKEYHRFIQNNVDPLFGATRHTQIQEVDADQAEQPLSPYERRLNRNLGVSAGITAVALCTSPLNPLIQFVSTVPLALYVAKDVYKAAYNSVVQKRKLTLPLLSAVNVTAMWVGGYFLIGGSVLFLIHMGMKLSVVTEHRSHKRLVSIFGEQPRKVWVLVNGVEVEIPFAELRAGDVVVVGAGQMVAVDGVIVSGNASIDQRMLTGESQPAEKGVGDGVLAATVVLSGQIAVRAEKAGQQTVAAKIGEMLENTANCQMEITSKAYRIAEASVAPTLAAAGVALFTVGYSGMVAITSTVFGFNLQISGPMALLTYLEVSSRQSILIKDGRSLETLTSIDTVVFDKTGTLTLDEPHVVKVWTFAAQDPTDVLRYAAAIEKRQSHPIAHAILAHARHCEVSLPAMDSIRYEVGYGLRAEIDGKLIRVGSERFMTLEGITLPSEALTLQDDSDELGHSVVMVAIGDEVVGAIELEPTVRPEAQSIIAKLRQRNLDIYIISGDQEGPTRRLAESLGIANYFANTLPENKAELVDRLQQTGRKVCFVGDGINDSIALKKANVSVSLSGATGVATDTAQIVLMDSTLRQLPLLFQLADEMDANLKTSLALAIVPGLGIWAGVFFLGLGIFSAAAIYEASLWVGMANALRPLLKYRQATKSLAADSTTPEATQVN